MARIRTIKPGFWKDEDLSALPADTHMLAAALLNYADDEGYFNANPALVKAECCPLRESSVSVHESLNLLQAIQFIKLGAAENGKQYGCVVNFGEHQRVNRPTGSKIKTLKIEWEGSPKAHPQITEPSPPEGKGREGKRKGERAREAPAPPPPDLDKAAWKRFAEYRTKIRKPIKPVSVEAAQRKLAGFGPDQAAVVEQSIAQGWAGLFALKEGAAPPPRRTKPYKPKPPTEAELRKDREDFKRDMERLGVKA